MIIKGMYDTDGRYVPFTTPLPVVQFGDTLRHADDGERLAIKENGEWFWASLHRLGIKCKIEIPTPDGDHE